MLEVGQGGSLTNDGITWEFALGADETEELDYSLRLPDVSGDYELLTKVYYQLSGNWKLYDRYSLTLTVPWNSEELLEAIIQAIENADVTGKDGKRIEKAIKELGKIKPQASKKKDADKNIKRILKAIKELRKVKSVDISEIRLRLDELLKIWQAKWSLLPGKVEEDDDEEDEHDKDNNKEEKEDEHSYLKQKEPVLVAATGSLTGLLGGVQKVEKLYFYHTDHLGTPIMITDENGSVVWEAEYLPFGEVYSMNGTVENNLRFPGQYFDSETGLHYNWHRYYKPEVGRYIEPDPIQYQKIILNFTMFCNENFYKQFMKEINLYVYGNNNPARYIDYYGLSFTDALKKRAFDDCVWSRYKNCQKFQGLKRKLCEKSVDAACAGEKEITCCEIEVKGCYGCIDPCDQDVEEKERICEIYRSICISKARSLLQ